jgi:hypothetical protein
VPMAPLVLLSPWGQGQRPAPTLTACKLESQPGPLNSVLLYFLT